MTQATRSLRTVAFARAALVAGVVIALDQITKHTLAAGIAAGEQKKFLPGVTLVHVRNTGVAFSLFSSGGTLVLVFTLIALAVLVGYFVRRPEKAWLWLPVGMLTGGAIGNLIDRIANGAVTDFIKLPHWPAFNVADMSITFGVLCSCGYSKARAPRRPPRSRERRVVSADSRTQLRVPEQAAGTRLDRFLAGPVGSRARAQNLIDAGRVRVDGALMPKRHLVVAGEAIEIDDAVLESGLVPDEQASFEIAYEDEYLMVVDKPAGVVVHPARGHLAGTLAQALAGRAAGGEDPWRAGIVHRLDRDTSGLLVVAKNDAVHRALKSLLSQRRLRREYLALVDGHPPARTGTIDAPIGRHRRDRKLMSIDSDDPREARTHFELERLLPSAALLARRARDRANAPDSGASCRNRPSGLRRPPVRHTRPLRPYPPVPPRRPAGFRPPGDVSGDRRTVRAAADLVAALR